MIRPCSAWPAAIASVFWLVLGGTAVAGTGGAESLQPVTGFYELTGATAFIGSQRGDMFDGPWMAWYPDGKPMMAGDFRMNRGIGTWKYFSPHGEKIGFKGLPGTWSHDGAAWFTFYNGTHLEFLLRDEDSAPILYYTHYRRIEATLHHHTVVLVNDGSCSDCLNVMLVDLTTLTHSQIGPEAVAEFRARTGFTWCSWEAGEFSRDAKRILFRVTAGGRGMDDRERERIGNRRIEWTYVLDARTGRILNVYESPEPPKDWSHRPPREQLRPRPIT